MKTISHPLAAVKAVVLALCLLAADSPRAFASGDELQAAQAAVNAAQAAKNAAKTAMDAAEDALDDYEDDLEDAEDDVEDAEDDIEDAVKETAKKAEKANKWNAKQKDIDAYNEALAEEQEARAELLAAQNALQAVLDRSAAYASAQQTYAAAVQALEDAQRALAEALINEENNDGEVVSDSDRIPADPIGWLTANPTIVQTGTKPTLAWSITYPSVVKDYVDIIPPATVDPKDTLDVEIRVLGNGVTVSSSNSNSYSFVDAEATLSFDGGSHTRIFYGDNYDVNPSTVVWSKKNVTAGQKLKFGGRYYYNGWGTFRHSTDGNQNVRTLVSGDTPPSNIPQYNAPSLEDFIKPYLGSDGKVNIGPMDVIVFMELTHSDSQQYDSGYDLQDMVLLVTFTSNKAKNNNGHGNNADGVDSSNPGNAPFMQYDSDPTVDDEAGGGGSYNSNP